MDISQMRLAVVNMNHNVYLFLLMVTGKPWFERVDPPLAVSLP